MKIVSKYIIVYLITVISIFLLLFFSALIPRELIKDNFVDSTKNFNYKFDMSWHMSDYGDHEYLDIAYVIDSEHPLKSIISMNGKMIRYLDVNSSTQYARYVHGPIIYIRPLLLITNYKGILLINVIIFIIVLLILLNKMLRIDKLLTLAFIITFISLSFFYTPNNISYCNCVLLGMIGTIIIINMYKKNSNNVGILFMVLGLLTNAFDFFTIESLSLTMPLFIYAYMHIKDKKELKIRIIIKYILIWFISYISLYLIKWGLAYTMYGKTLFHQIFALANYEGFNTNFVNPIDVFLTNIKLILPFYYIESYIPLLILILGIFIYIFITKVDKKKYINIYILMLIPIIRFMCVFVQAYRFPFTTFRTLFPIVLFMNIIFIKYIKELITN